MPFPPKNPAFAERVRASFGNQRVMAEFGATLSAVEAGVVEIALPFHERWTQQHGFIHAGVVAAILDSACGYAAFSLMSAEASVLTVEYKINLLAPAMGDVLVARGRVLRPGRTLTTCQGEVTADHSGELTVVAAMQATIMTVLDRPDVVG